MAATLDASFLTRLDALRLSVRWMRWGHHLGGRFIINRRGSSIEFADYSAYTPGDDIRAIDWNLYARLDRLFVKTYKEEVELSVEVLVDATASMALPSPKKFERATQIASCLAYIGLAGRHHVRMSWIAPGALQASSWFFHRGDFGRLSERAEAVRPAGTQPMAAWMDRAVAGLRIRGGQAIVLSDWMVHPAESFRALHRLLGKRVEVKVIQVLMPQELDPARLFRGGLLVDSETGQTHQLAYPPEELARAVIDHNETLARFCKRNGLPLAQHRVDESLETFLLHTLPARGFLE